VIWLVDEIVFDIQQKKTTKIDIKNNDCCNLELSKNEMCKMTYLDGVQRNTLVTLMAFSMCSQVQSLHCLHKFNLNIFTRTTHMFKQNE